MGFNQGTPMKNNASLIYNACLVVGDFLALVAAFVGAYILRVRLRLGINQQQLGIVHARTYIEIFFVLLPFWILIFALLGLYNSNIYERRFAEAGRLLVGSFIGMLFVIFWDFAAAKPIFPARLIPIYGFGLGFLFLLIFRNIARLVRTQLFSYSIGLTNVLLVGSTNMTRELVNSLADSRRSGYQLLGVVGSKQFVDQSHVPVFRSFDQFLETDLRFKLHRIIQTELYANESTNSEILSYAQEQHVGYRFVPGNTELFVGNIEVELFRSEIPVIAVHQTALFGWGRVVKRIFDLLLGGILLLIASPIMLILAVAVKLEDGGPIFLRQVRLTRFNQEFRVFKFRSNNVTYNGLTPDEAFAKMGRADLLAEFRANGNYLLNDPRNTRVGRFIRATSLDEIPQLFNVITGELSLVGPRALIPKDLAEYKKRHTILSVKAGITGLAQVSGRNSIPFDERRKLDLYYVQNWSFWLDMIILFKTFRAILNHEDDNQ
jgi:exopolysaccharide biosynthesis polyprenyl glycosylphosphotransferase